MLTIAKEENERSEIKTILETQLRHWDEQKFIKETDDKILNFILEIIRISRKNNLPIDLSVMPNSLPEIIKLLFLLKPSDAEWVLNLMQHNPKIEILFEMRDSVKTKTHIFDPVENTALLHCLSKIKLKINCTADLYEEMVDDFMQINSEHAVTLALHDYIMIEMTSDDVLNDVPKQISSQKIYEKILAYDSPNALQAFLKHVKEKGEPAYAFIFGKLSTYWKQIKFGSMLSAAINAHAPRSVAVLINSFDFFSPETLEPFIQQTVKNRDPVLLLALCRNEPDKAANYLFSNSFSKETQEQLHDDLITMLRFYPIEILDKIVGAYNNDQNKTTLHNSYSKAKEEFLHYAPAFSRTGPREFAKIKKRYGRDVSASTDMEYGKNRSALVKDLAEQLKNSTPEKPFKPTRKDFLTLPTSKKGSRIFAALVEKIADYNSDNNPRYKKEFSSLNQDRSVFTSLSGYQWGAPLLTAIFHHSKSTQIIKYPNLKTTEFGLTFYSLTYNDKIISEVLTSGAYDGMAWRHGKLPLKDTIGEIEDLLDKMRIPLKRDPGPKATEQEIKEYQRGLTQFYAEAAQLVWLIGNTTPLQRGSGSVAELTLKTIFEAQGLRAPTLKLAFPQLDVLDISFPQDDYVKLFTYFCEPSSLPLFLQKPSLSYLSASEQLVAYYNEINGVALIPRGPTDSFAETTTSTNKLTGRA